MKKTIIKSCLIFFAIALIASPTFAAKPLDVIEKSNGAPSGMHFNLNIHGKKYDYLCEQTPGGNSVFVPEYQTTTIQYVSNKKSSLTQLEVLDRCDWNFYNPPDNDPVKVMLPHKVEVDGTVIPAEGFHVVGRILAKPNNGKNDAVSSIILHPNVVLEACNDDLVEPDPDFGTYTSCDDLALGLIVDNNLYTAKAEYYERFDSGSTKGKGKSKFTDLSPLFTYTGWAVDARLDIDGDGDIDQDDVPVDAWEIILSAGYDPNLFDDDSTFGDGNDTISLQEWLLFQASLQTPMAWYFSEDWIFNIADLVVTEQGLEMGGAKLFQIRFYPVATTQFAP